MKKTWLPALSFILAGALLIPVTTMAQEEKEKESRIVKEKEKKDGQQIIITRKNNSDEKMVIEVNGDKVTINGKPCSEYCDENKNVNVHVNKLKDIEFLTTARIPNVSGNWNFNSDQHQGFFTEDDNRAMLGVTTDKTDEGTTILSITKESAAEKMGLKQGDVITKMDGKAISSPDELTTAIKSHKPGDKVTVTYLRDKKENTATAELGKWKSQNFKMDMGDMKWDQVMPKIQTVPRTAYTYTGKTPKLGLSVQDTDDGKGVKVIEVDAESNAAKAGLKENDIVTEIDGKAVNSTDEVVKSMKDNKDKVSVMFKLSRNGKTQNVEVKMPRAIKTKDL